MNKVYLTQEPWVLGAYVCIHTRMYACIRRYLCVFGFHESVDPKVLVHGVNVYVHAVHMCVLLCVLECIVMHVLIMMFVFR